MAAQIRTTAMHSPGGSRETRTAPLPRTGAPRQKNVFAWTSSRLSLRAAHPALKTGLEQNLVADSDVFAFVRSSEEAGCSSDHKKERYLVIANKAQQSKLVVIPESETALEGCTEFPLMPAEAADPLIREGKLQIEEPAQSMTLYEVR